MIDDDVSEPSSKSISTSLLQFVFMKCTSCTTHSPILKLGGSSRGDIHHHGKHSVRGFLQISPPPASCCRPSQEFLHFDIASQTSQLKQGRIIPSPSRCYDLRRGTLPQEPCGDILSAVRDGVVERVVTSPVLPREIGSFRKQVPIERE